MLAADGAGEVDLFDADELLRRPVAWLFGNEAWGLPAELAALADHRVRIPIPGRAESLNLATAAAVCLYATARARRSRLGCRRAPAARRQSHRPLGTAQSLADALPDGILRRRPPTAWSPCATRRRRRCSTSPVDGPSVRRWPTCSGCRTTRAGRGCEVNQPFAGFSTRTGVPEQSLAAPEGRPRC